MVFRKFLGNRFVVVLVFIQNSELDGLKLKPLYIRVLLKICTQRDYQGTMIKRKDCIVKKISQKQKFSENKFLMINKQIGDVIVVLIMFFSHTRSHTCNKSAKLRFSGKCSLTLTHSEFNMEYF